MLLSNIISEAEDGLQYPPELLDMAHHSLSHLPCCPPSARASLDTPDLNQC